ncbi:MAG: hypothetical protein IT376_01140 [Polyangiaceae bacterium]|nr:hypothetical protein [Polyangiaceae bacterium]
MALPQADAVSRLLRDLFGKPVQVKPTAPLAGPTIALLAVYADAQDTTAAVVASDLAFAAFGGAALAMIPRSVAEECVKRKRLDDNLRENFYEVVNIMAATLNSNDARHHRLVSLVEPAQAPSDARAVLQKPAKRVDFEVSVPDFGVGRLSMLVCA